VLLGLLKKEKERGGDWTGKKKGEETRIRLRPKDQKRGGKRGAEASFHVPTKLVAGKRAKRRRSTQNAPACGCKQQGLEKKRVKGE